MLSNCGAGEDSCESLGEESNEIKALSPKGKQPWIIIGRTDAEAEVPILWLPDVKSQPVRKDPDAGNDWGQEEKGTTEYYTYKGAPTIPSSRLREKLIKDGIKQDVCEYCGNSHWLGKKLPLELHHLDGNHFNNELENLRIICPNCHAVSGLNAGAAAGSYSAE